MSHTARTVVRGIGFNTGANLLKTFVQFVIVIPILARLLTPDEFGLAGMAVAFIMFFSQFSDFGISTALVRHEAPGRALWSSAFWTNLGLGLLLTGLAFLCAPLIASFFDRPSLTPIVKVLSLVILLHCTFLIPMAWLQRELKFKTIAVIDVTSVLLSAAAAITAAIMGLGVWALVLQQLSLFAAKVVASLFCHRADIALVYSPREIVSVLSFSLRLTASEFIGFIHRNIDNILIGKFLGAAALGFYGRAFTIMLVPVHALGTSAAFALYPVMAQSQADRRHLSMLYLKTCMALTSLVAPMMTGLAIVAQPFVAVWLGPDWLPVAPLITLLVFAGLIQTLQTMTFTLWKALGRADVLLHWSVIQTVVFTSAFVLGVWLGDIELLAAAYLVGTLLIFGPFQWLTCRQLDLPLRAFAAALTPGLTGAVLMGGLLLAMQYILPEAMTDAGRLACLIPLGMALYGLSWAVLFPTALRELRDDIRQLRPPAGITGL